MRVLLKLRRNKRNPNAIAVIYCRIKLDSQHATDFSTFVAVMPSQWDSTKQRIRGNTLQANDDNMKLEQLRSDITRLFLQFQAATESVSAQRLADLYTGKAKRMYTFSELIDLFALHVEATYTNPGTKRNYNTRLRNIRLFLDAMKWKVLPADQFTLGSADEFVRWMKTAGHEHQSIVRHTQVLKNITEDAVRREILKVDKLSVFRLRKKERVNTAHLTRAEIGTLETLDWRPAIGRIVDIFLFSIYTGLHYDDAQTLVPDDVRLGIDGRKWLFKVRGKYAGSEFFVNESVQVVPLSEKALAMIDKYDGIENLPKISNAKFNSWLKQIQHMAEIKTKLTVKVARKTFTHMMLNELGVSEESVATMLGHNTTRTVRYYGRAGEERVAKEVIYK